MPDTQDVAKLIKRICTETLAYENFRDDEDFFDRGASSLTIVELQLKIEEALGWTVPTSELMLNSSIAGWTRVYRTASPQQLEPAEQPSASHAL